MTLPNLEEMQSAVRDVIEMAKMELERARLLKQRKQKIEEYAHKIREQLSPQVIEIENLIQEFDREGDTESFARKQLEQKLAQLKEYIEKAPLVAEQEADYQLIATEERIQNERDAAQEFQWRQALKEDLLEMIAEQDDFYSATDAAVAIKPYINDLKAINALEEVVEALMNQINKHSGEGPVAKLKGTYENTINFIYNKAMENRARVERPPNVQATVRHRKTEKRPVAYEDLEGKVLVFGGHDRLHTAVKNRLRYSKVELVWCTEQDGLQIASQGEEQINSSDLVIIVTGYASHSLTERAIEACKRLGKNYEIVNTTGMTSVLQVIEAGLKTIQLAKRWK
ncbi:MAG: DUF2325 domain-containing protein [Pseudanabaenaceae cyanobacterium]